jgi:hypothetical protein
MPNRGGAEPRPPESVQPGKCVPANAGASRRSAIACVEPTHNRGDGPDELPVSSDHLKYSNVGKALGG